MRSRTIVEDEILALSTRDESHFFDRKALGISGKKAQKIAVAFANADGGEFVIGISDDREEPDPAKRWHGTTRLEDLNGLLQALFDVKPTLELTYEVLNSHSRPGQVLRVIVEKSAEVHKTSDGTVYQRYGAQSLPVDDPQRITELAFAKGRQKKVSGTILSPKSLWYRSIEADRARSRSCRFLRNQWFLTPFLTPMPSSPPPRCSPIASRMMDWPPTLQ